MVSCSGELLVCKTVRIAAEVSCRAGHGFIVKIMMAVHIENHIIPAFLHLATRVRRAVDVEVLKEAVRTFVIEVVLSRPSDREILDMHIERIGMHGDTARAVWHFVKIQRYMVARIAGDDDTFGGGALLVDAEFVCKLICTFDQIERVAGIAQQTHARSKRGGREIRTAVAQTIRRSVVRGSKGAK